MLLVKPQGLESALRNVLGDAQFAAVLPKVIAAIAREETTAGVASRIVSQFVCTLGARSAVVYRVAPGERLQRVAGYEGEGEVADESFASIGVSDDVPLARAVRTSLIQLVGATDADSGPRAATWGLELPLFSAGKRVIGAVSATFDEDPARRSSTFAMLCDTLGALVDRAQLRDEVVALKRSGLLRDARTTLIAHDLRQPLGVILMSAAFLAKGGTEDRAMVERLRRGVSLLDRMILDLNDLSLLESGRFTLSLAMTDVVRVVEATVASHMPTATLSVEGDIPEIQVDAHRVEQILANLLINASKYGSPVSATRVAVVRDERSVLVSVSNDGGGIPADERTKVFDPYYRAQEHTRGVPGLGLGLYICKKIVEEHGGKIWTDTESSRTRFTFSLPLVRATVRGAADARPLGESSPTTADALTT